MMDDAFGRWLRERRRERGLTQQALADAAGLSHKTVFRAERGQAVSAYTREQLTALLGEPPLTNWAREDTLFWPYTGTRCDGKLKPRKRKEVHPMTYERIKIKHELKMNLNYGEIDGKIKKKLKTIGGLDLDETVATSEAVIKTAKALGTLMEPIVQDITNVMYYDNVETA